MKTILRFFSWSKKQTIVYIAIVAIIAWVAFWILSHIAGTETYPIGYFQKIPFGILGINIIMKVAFVWMKMEHPRGWDSLDDETEGGVSNISEWEKVKVSLYWITIFVLGACFLAFSL